MSKTKVHEAPGDVDSPGNQPQLLGLAWWGKGIQAAEIVVHPARRVGLLWEG